MKGERAGVERSLKGVKSLIDHYSKHVEKGIIPIYTDRNGVQMSPSHRLDLNMTLHGNKKKKFWSEVSFGCYNTYNRAQPYRVNIVPQEGGLGYKYEQPGLFGFIPSVAYSFQF